LRASFSVGRFLFQGAKPLSRRSPTRAERQSIARANRWRYPEPTRVLGATEMIKKSRYSYSDTIAQLSKTITDAGNTIFATIDQSAAAAKVGLTLRPTLLIIFGNPKGGTALMVAFPIVALDLPLKILVWEENGSVNVAYVPASEIAARYGLDGMNTQISAMDQALDKIASSVT
jgi:uncharacterized protein (DUF302 family)